MAHNMATTQWVRNALSRAGYKGANLIRRNTQQMTGYVVHDSGNGFASVTCRIGDHVADDEADQVRKAHMDEFEEVLLGLGAYVHRQGDYMKVARVKPEWYVEQP